MGLLKFCHIWTQKFGPWYNCSTNARHLAPHSHLLNCWWPHAACSQFMLHNTCIPCTHTQKGLNSTYSWMLTECFIVRIFLPLPMSQGLTDIIITLEKETLDLLNRGRQLLEEAQEALENTTIAFEVSSKWGWGGRCVWCVCVVCVFVGKRENLNSKLFIIMISISTQSCKLFHFIMIIPRSTQNYKLVISL